MASAIVRPLPVLVTMLLLACCGASLSAQAPAVLTANARLVVLDATVTDSQGKPVDTLTAADFQVYEDGKLQRIRSVEPPAAHVLPAGSDSAETVFDPAHPASFGQSPVDLLVLDQLNTHFADSSYARRALHDYLAAQPALLHEPATLLSVYDDHFKQLAHFTRDRNQLLAALAAAPTQYAWKLETNGKTATGPLKRLDQSLRALTEMSESYARIPGRKNLIWVGGGFPSQDPAALAGRDLDEVKQAIQHVTNILLESRVTLYAVDPTTTAAGMTEITDATQMAFVTAVGDAGSAGSLDPFSTTEDFDRLGPLTGGRVIRARNDVAAQIAQSVALGDDFYSIAYTPSSESTKEAKYRKITVVCLRPGLKAVTREGYYTGSAKPQDIQTDTAFDLTTAAESTVPLNALSVTAAVGALPQSYVVKVTAPNLTWKAQPDGSATAAVYVMAVSLDSKGRMLGHTLHGMKASALPGAVLTDPAVTADFVFEAVPAAKAATLRFVVRDSATGKLGSFDLPLGR